MRIITSTSFKRSLILILVSIASFWGSISKSFAKTGTVDTVKTGIYITSIHDIDFKQKEYTVIFWLWLKYTNKEFDFLQNLEIPQAKTLVKSFSTIDTSDGKIYILMKVQCVMKDSWKTNNFPFDSQKLRLSIENSQFDSHSLVFSADTVGKKYDPRFTLSGWNINQFDVSIAPKSYETTFGDPNLKIPHTEYSSFRVGIEIQRDAIGLFWKMFLGMYVAFLIAYISCYIHLDNIDSRFGLSVGALFAVIGNKYIVDSSLPESITYTLVDTLHGITLLAILVVTACTVFSLRLVKQDKPEQAQRFDVISAQILLFVYLFLNIYFIVKANTPSIDWIHGVLK